MKKTGIKVWVLTGDKIETAENIGFSAGLLDNAMDKFYLKQIEESKLQADLEKMVEMIKSSQK
jgi:magnesium-transporting ATPase (P-type)